MPSASTLPAMAVASPQAGPSDNAIMSYVSSMIQHRVQLFATIEQFVIGEYQIISQEIAQAVYSFQQQVGGFFGINPNSQNQTINTTATQASSDSGAGRGNSSGSGSGGGAMSSGHNAANQALNNATQPSGQGSGSGSSATTAYHNGSLKAQPMTSGTGTGSGSATVYGNVWLDSNYDGGIDNGELGYYGATVQLDRVGYGGYLSTTTDQSGNYKFTLPAPSIPPGYTWEVQVVFPSGFFATVPGYSQIDAEGFSQQFNLVAGDVVQVNAGIASMNVNTTADDPGNQKIQNKVTLRDAIQTGNNGPPQPAITFDTAPNTPLTGTISLQAGLDAIKTSYNIVGSGASNLTVQGNGNAQNPYRIFTINAGVTTTISGLTIKGGYDVSGTGGGGILSQGKLTLQGDVITGNQASGFGGGLYINGGTATVSGGSISNNTALGQNGGGIYVNLGSLKLTHDVTISTNNANAANGNGGGMYINQGVVTMTGGSIVKNTSGLNGGGIYNYAGSLTLNASGNGPVEIMSNGAANEGGGLYLGKGSTTTFNACNVGGLLTHNGATTGKGVYWQNFATVTTTGLNDGDDPFGQPVKGP